jgi:hypothetical protein
MGSGDGVTPMMNICWLFLSTFKSMALLGPYLIVVVNKGARGDR